MKRGILVLRGSGCLYVCLFEKTVRTHNYALDYMRLHVHLYIVGKFGEILQIEQDKCSPVL